ncbi:hypothetical protein [Fusobacterium varium]|mgnify:CR=1 FL=1|uniref:hypothetical protein n=1 Tax=Fusobacterium varium TaxID=856 RepID=UPI0027DE8624|nr:hypothetical protein [uncultured Fusobacterium sp.]
MKKIISVLSFAFIAAAMVNFIGVSYFKQANIASFKNYSIFYGNNINKFDALLNNEKTSKETKEKIIELTEMYKTFESNGMKNPKEMIEFHVGSIRKGTPTIGTYYQLYKFGKHLDEQVKTGENILRDDK